MSHTLKFLIFTGIALLGCTSTKVHKQDTLVQEMDQNSTSFSGSLGTNSGMTTGHFDLDGHFSTHEMPGNITLLNSNVSDAFEPIFEFNEDGSISLEEVTPKALGMPEYTGPISPVAKRIVENYFNSKNKQPGGHCLAVSKNRFEKAYKDVYNHSVYEDLPERMATPFYTPKEAFDFLYISASGSHEGWRSLPIEYRGKGNAGAIAYAGMGMLVGYYGIWSGELRPGAMMQVWKHKEDYDKVVMGINSKDFDPFGHSFIFIGYVRDENHNIIGIRIADQGYQSYRTLIANDYEVWWAVNLII